MQEKLTYWLSVFFSMGSLALLVSNVFVINANHGLQEHISERQKTIANGQSLSQFGTNFVHTLADAAIKQNDRDIRALLSTQGLTIKDASPEASLGAHSPEINSK